MTSKLFRNHQNVRDVHFFVLFVFKFNLEYDHKIKIVAGSGCYSYVGFQGVNHQTISLREVGCLSRGTVQHEFMHALGFYHEQARPDAKDFIKVQEWVIILSNTKYILRCHVSTCPTCDVSQIVIHLNSIKMLAICAAVQVKSHVAPSSIHCPYTSGNHLAEVELMISAPSCTMVRTAIISPTISFEEKPQKRKALYPAYNVIKCYVFLLRSKEFKKYYVVSQDCIN